MIDGEEKMKEINKPDKKSPRCRCNISFFSTEVYAGRNSNSIDIRTQEQEVHNYIDNLDKSS